MVKTKMWSFGQSQLIKYTRTTLSEIYEYTTPAKQCEGTLLNTMIND